MEFEVIQAQKQHQEILSNLMQFYIYDFSEFLKFDVEKDGLYSEYPLEEYWKEEDHRFAYMVKQEDKYVGFVLVKYMDTREQNYYSIAEFFIFKKYRKEGIGKAVATHIFDLHQGKWEVCQIEDNTSAQIFWHKTIDEYTKGRFAERIEKGKVIQTFMSHS